MKGSLGYRVLFCREKLRERREEKKGSREGGKGGRKEGRKNREIVIEIKTAG